MAAGRGPPAPSVSASWSQPRPGNSEPTVSGCLLSESLLSEWRNGIWYCSLYPRMSIPCQTASRSARYLGIEAAVTAVTAWQFDSLPGCWIWRGTGWQLAGEWREEDQRVEGLRHEESLLVFTLLVHDAPDPGLKVPARLTLSTRMTDSAGLMLSVKSWSSR